MGLGIGGIGSGTSSFSSGEDSDVIATGIDFSSSGGLKVFSASTDLSDSSAFFFFATGFLTLPSLRASASWVFLTLIFKFLANA